MSDHSHDDEGFRAIDVRSLDRFDAEVSHKAGGAEPDLDRFRLLFDPVALALEKEGTFEALYSFVKDDKDEPFVPLIEGAGEPVRREPAPEPSPEEPEEQIPEKTPEEIGFETGYARGLEEGHKVGMVQGEAKGYEKGFAQGQAEGLEKGQAEGLEKGIEQGHEQGFEQGRQQAEAEVQKESGKIIEPLKTALETADRLLDRMVTRYEGQILELIYRIAEKAVIAKVETDDEVVKYTILDALKSLVAPEEITLIVCAEDYEYVQMVKDEFFEAVQSLKHVAVSSDPMIERGGCRIETATATIATDPGTKLSAVYDALARAKKP